MVMIRCPECGQRVLDVASSCPHCHRVLIQNPLETHDWTALVECGRCHKHIERSARECPYCGHNVRAARVATRTVAGVVGVAVAVSVILVKTGALTDLARSFHPAPPATTPAPQPPAVATQAPDTAVGEATVPDSAQPASTEASPSPQVAETTPPPSAAPPPTALQLVTRWTAEWANVRQGRSIESPALQVLPPGREIRVGDRQQGWWAVYADARPIGYIANSVLTATPPSDPG